MKEKRDIERQFYHFFCDYLMEVIKLFSISKKEMMRRMEFVGLDEVRADLERENKKLHPWLTGCPRYIVDRFIIGYIISRSMTCF